MQQQTNDFRERVITPLLMPLGILAVIAVTVGFFAWMLLWSTKFLALILAIVAASVILAAISLVSSQEKLDAPKKAVVGGFVAIPMLIGALFAGGVIGDVDAADLNINRQPHEPTIAAPEGAPVVVAEDSVEFVTKSFELPAEGLVAFTFDNEQSGVVHNVWIFEGPTTEDPLFFQGENITGPASIDYGFEAPGEEGTWLYFCSIHPNMQGEVTFSFDATAGLIG